MFQCSKLNRLIVAGITAAAIAPAAAIASPALDGGVAAPGSGVTQDLRAPDQADGSTVDRSAPGMPTWPVNPQPIPHRPVATTSTPSADGDGIDGGVLIALGGGALLAVGGLGLAGRKRLQVVRQRQLA
ncbi:MAG TPA: hypothetical protein VFY32_01160 [Solirubrobacteraceae bacterium]|jgi:hypothetical protein|nr:hypothetical protein [Solirubrobacteraceae bacterium]